ncbi:cupredoxin domain-containing protein [Pendulispora albinea]|uniref:Cupredoxin domain-containing protein n=1 Tax=Pendulispora albinea TaxID=2741071 RepID=A0ABZ2LLA8_9BACT
MRIVAALVPLALAASLGVAGCNKSDDPQNLQPVSGEQKVEANEKGFTPSTIAVKKGSTTHLVFTRTTADTCATEVVFPDLGIQKELPVGKPVSVDIPADQDKTLRFACGMGMFNGKVVVK